MSKINQESVAFGKVLRSTSQNYFANLGSVNYSV